MADENAAPEEEYNDDGTKNPTYVAPKADSESADDTKNKVKDDDGGEEDGEFDDTVDPTKPLTIPVRSNLQHIIARKNEKIRKLESQGVNDTPMDDIGGDDDDDTDLTPDAVKAIGKNVQKAIAPLMSKLASDADKAEFEELIKAEPDAAKYANHIKAYMEHDAYKGVSPAVIYHHLAFNAAQAIGAKRKSAADLEAKQNKSGGRTIPAKGNVGNLPSADDIEEMSDAEFEKMENDARQGKYSK